jgi:hypothetical protein
VAAREAGALLPEQAPALRDAARVFDDIWYGQAAAAAEDYRRLVAVDEAVAAARVRVRVPDRSGSSGSSDSLGSSDSSGTSGASGSSGPR